MSEETYVEKCFKCKHCYTRKNKNESEDYIYCRLKECRFESRTGKPAVVKAWNRRADDKPAYSYMLNQPKERAE